MVGDHPEDELDYDDDEGYGDTDDEDFEQEALMAEEDMPEEEGWSYEEFDDEEVDEIDQQALQEAFAAGWKAKNKTAAAKQARGYKGDGKPSKGKGKGKRPDSRNPEDRKRNSTCASCGQRGHWRGDSVCPNVRSGKDPPHRKENSTHFTTGRSDRGSASAATVSAREHSRDDREPLQRKPHPSGLKSTGKAAPPDPPHRGAIDKSPAENPENLITHLQNGGSHQAHHQGGSVSQKRNRRQRTPRRSRSLRGEGDRQGRIVREDQRVAIRTRIETVVDVVADKRRSMQQRSMRQQPKQRQLVRLRPTRKLLFPSHHRGSLPANAIGR